FKVLHDSKYQLSWSFDLQGVQEKELECVGAFAHVDVALDIDVTLFGPDGPAVWDSTVHAYDSSVDCFAGNLITPTVEEIHPSIDPVATPQLSLHPGVYQWQTQVTLLAKGNAVGIAHGRLEAWFTPHTLESQSYNKWAK